MKEQVNAVTKEKKGLLILAHGSKVKETDETVKRLAEAVKIQTADTFDAVGYGFLQMANPTMAEAARKLAEAGVTRVHIAPFFLFRGNHLREDIPEELENLKKEYPHLNFTMGGSIGDHPAMTRVLLDQIEKDLSA
ncbi:CbiX/SirB N-terminal domain-containing protein [Anoxynatronum sibiricum]|uniref:CbiX/SirB N-terminal domain-containing protein n=1 Tax=Anoxynatronum sibiricum TaxID=210623 RepID=A0ABU9VSP8_9CLOT